MQAGADAQAVSEASIRLPSSRNAAGCETACLAIYVTLGGDLAGEYVVGEQRDDGSLVVRPDTSMEAICRRHNMTPATLEQFEAEYGPLQPPDREA